MKQARSLALGILIFANYACAAQSDIGSDLYEKEAIAISDIPAQAMEAVLALQPDFNVLEAEKELKHGNHYLDLEGETRGGAEIEFDLLLNEDNKWEVVEIQRDLNLNECPAPVQSLFKDTFRNKAPQRIIESKQMDGAIIYEFYFVEKGQETTKKEIKLVGNDATLLEQEWTH